MARGLSAALRSVRWSSVGLALISFACSSPAGDAPPTDPRLRELSTALRSLAGGDSVLDAPAIGESLRELLEAAVADAESSGLRLVDSSPPPASFELVVVDAAGDPLAGLHLLYRPDRPEALARAYGEERVGGYVARITPGEQVFILVGRFEVRVYQRSPSFSDDRRLRELVERLPLEALESL